MWDRSLAVDRAAEGVDDAAEEPLANWNGEKFASGFDFRAFADLCVIAKNDDADFGFLEVQSDAGDSAWEFNHFIEFDGAETFDAGDTVADFTDGSDIRLAGGVAFDGADFFFEFEDDVAHVTIGSGLFKCFETGLDAAIPDIAAEFHAKASDERRGVAELGGNFAEFAGEVG